MSIDDLFLGQSLSVQGATNLRRNAKLDIKEGYFTGASYEYVDIGFGYVDQLENNRGVNRNRLYLAVSSTLKKLENWRTDTIINYDSFDLFLDKYSSDNLTNNYRASTGGIFSSESRFLVGASNADNETLNLINIKPKKNYVAEIKWVPKNTGSQGIIGVRSQNLDKVSNTTTHTSYFLAAHDGTDTFALFRREDGTGGAVLTDNTTINVNDEFYLRIVCQDNRVFGLYSDDSLDWTLIGDTIIADDNPIQEGNVFIGAGVAKSYFDDFKVLSLDRMYTVRDIVEDISFKSGIESVDIPYLYEQTFSQNTGGFTVVDGVWGVTNGELLGQNAGTSANVEIFRSGYSFINFYAEVDFFIGSSNTRGGLIVGKGDSTFLFANWRGFSNNSGLGDRITNPESSELLGNTRINTNFHFPHDYPFAGTWNKFQVYKIEEKFILGINGYATAHFEGTSTINIDTENFLGFGLFGTVDNEVRARNFRVLELGDIPKDFEISTDSRGVNAVNRLSDLYDFEMIPSGNRAKIIANIGSERDVSRNFDNINDNYTFDNYNQINDTGHGYFTLQGSNELEESIENKEFIHETGEFRDTIKFDRIIKTVPDNVSATKSRFNKTNRKQTEGSFQVTANIDLERYDVINVVDSGLGISANYIIQNMNKNFNPDVGSFTQTLTLAKNGSGT